MNRKLALNTISSLLFQITTLICGFILPRAILSVYGSEVNGLVSSITQFLSLISFLELGVGAVIQSSLYKPLAHKDSIAVSKVIISGQKFFKKIAYTLLVYILILAVFYPLIINGAFGWSYTALLIIAISISSFAQYYFGIVDRLLLTADQRGYIQYVSQTITLVTNTIVCIVLINIGASIHLVKLTTSIIYLVRPLVLRKYVNKHYRIDYSLTLKEEPIKQKWNGIAQHVAAIVLNDTDTIVLTILSTLSNVSIYSVYFMVVNGIKAILISATNGVQSVIGEYLAKEEKNKLKLFFSEIEFAIHLAVVFCFTCTGILIVPFVRVYTQGISDVNYIQPVFAALLVVAHACHCLRIPYNIVILAGGHYKQTQKCYIWAAIINIVISVITVYYWGLIGVALGTLVAMVYQTIWMALYNSKNLINWPIKITIKQFAIDALSVCLILVATKWIKFDITNYFTWFITAIIVALVAFFVLVVINFFFYKKELLLLIQSMSKKARSK